MKKLNIGNNLNKYCDCISIPRNEDQFVCLILADLAQSAEYSHQVPFPCANNF